MKKVYLLLFFTFIGISQNIDAGKVPLVIKGNSPAKFSTFPLRCGIPFPKNTLKKEMPLALINSRGVSQVLQKNPIAFWNKEKSDVRWLLIDFIAQKGESYILVYGKEAEKFHRHKAKGLIREEGGSLYINTGKLKAQCDKNKFDIFKNIKAKYRSRDLIPMIDKAVHKNKNLFSGPYIEHETKGIFRADLDSEVKIEIEENGPVHAVLKADGWYTNQSNEKFSRFSFRLNFYKGQPHIKFEHTFIYTGSSESDRIRDIALQLPLQGKISKSQIVQFGRMFNEKYTDVVPMGGFDHLYQVMDHPDHLNFEYKIHDGMTGKVHRVGEKAAGWMFNYASHASVLGVLKNAWQQSPFELEREKNVTRFHFWPKHGRLLDTSYEAITRHLSEEQKLKLIGKKPKVNDNPEKIKKVYEKSKTRNAHGFAKTHELWLFFGVSGSWNGLGGPHFDYVHQPVTVHADLEWQSRSKALDFLSQHPYDPKNFRDEELYLENVLDMLAMNRELTHMYGWFDFGGYHGEHLPLVPGHVALTGSHRIPKWHRNKPKSHYYLGSFPWMMYYRTGRREWLNFAQNYTLYSANTSYRHHSDKKMGRAAGEEYHYDNSEVHWLGGYYPMPGGAILSGNIKDRKDYIYQYWLTGDRRAFDILLMWAENFEYELSKGHVWIERMIQGGPYGNWIRNIGGLMERLTLCYEATFDERFIERAKPLAEVFYDMPIHENFMKKDKNGNTQWHSLWYMNWLLEGMWRYYHMTGDEKIKNRLMEYCEIAVDNNYPHNGNWTAYGYELTKNLDYIDLARFRMDRTIEHWVSNTNSFKPGYSKHFTCSYPRLFSAISMAPQDWKEWNFPMHKKNIRIEYIYYNPDQPNKVADRPIYFRENVDREFEIRFYASQGGTFGLFDPKGRLVAQKDEMSRYPKRAIYSMMVPKDGETGTYTLLCLKNNGKYRRWQEDLPFLFLINRGVDKVVWPVNSEPSMLNLKSRAWFFNIPANTVGAHVEWQPPSPQSCGERNFILESIDGRYLLNTKDMPIVSSYTDNNIVSYRYKFELPQLEKDMMFCLRADNQRQTVLTQDQSHMSLRPDLVLSGVPAYISNSAESYFVPNPPKKLNLP